MSNWKMKFRNWIITLDNFGDEDVDKWTFFFRHKDNGLEKSPGEPIDLTPYLDPQVEFETAALMILLGNPSRKLGLFGPPGASIRPDDVWKYVLDNKYLHNFTRQEIREELKPVD